jgi:hypothetical protein
LGCLCFGIEVLSSPSIRRLFVSGTVWTATAHIVTAVIGSGVLALPWSVAQLGWVAGPLALAGFACVTYYTSTLLANAYRAPHPVTGARNRTYMDAVRSYLSISRLSSHAQLPPFFSLLVELNRIPG